MYRSVNIRRFTLDSQVLAKLSRRNIEKELKHEPRRNAHPTFIQRPTKLRMDWPRIDQDGSEGGFQTICKRSDDAQPSKIHGLCSENPCSKEICVVKWLKPRSGFWTEQQCLVGLLL